MQRRAIIFICLIGVTVLLSRVPSGWTETPSEFICAVTSSGELYEIDAATYKVSSRVQIPGLVNNLGTIWGLYGFRNKLLIADALDNFVRVYDLSAKQLIKNINIGQVSLDGGVKWQDQWGFWIVVPRTVAKVNLLLNEVEGWAALPEGADASSLDLAPNGRIYIPDSIQQKVYVLDPKTMKMVQELATSDRYETVRIAGNGRAYFVGWSKDGTTGDWIDVWNTHTNTFVKRLTRLLSGGAFVSGEEGYLGLQQPMIVTNKFNRLVAIAGEPGPVSHSRRSTFLLGIDLATNKVVWTVDRTDAEDFASFMALSSRGDLFVTVKGQIKVINVVNGTLKTTIPITSISGIADIIRE
jgi:outer membrane protein assembly factor BamB